MLFVSLVFNNFKWRGASCRHSQGTCVITLTCDLLRFECLLQLPYITYKRCGLATPNMLSVVCFYAAAATHRSLKRCKTWTTRSR
jgi:hypothetical protein